MAKKGDNKIGSWAFLIGFICALIFGLFGVSQEIAWLLVVAGLIVGLLNIKENETQKFLLGGTVLVIVSALGNEVMSMIPAIGNVLNAILILFIPATIIVALKSVFLMAKK